MLGIGIGVDLGIGSIYGPSDNACDGFFSTIKDTVRGWNGIPCILGGDWNATGSYEDLNFNPDVMFMRSIPSRYRSEQVELLCEELDLADPFRALHPDLRDFTSVMGKHPDLMVGLPTSTVFPTND
jgi:hypothetical protein